jgi:hypothetical protein
MTNSCAGRPAFLSDLFGLFAGAALINFIMPTSNLDAPKMFADMWTYGARGSLLAGYALANPYGSIKSAWDATLDSIPQGASAACPNLDSNYTYGGGHGISGCGGHASMAMDTTSSNAQWDLNNTSWATTQNEADESFGNAYWYWYIHCNFDCNTYPLIK